MVRKRMHMSALIALGLIILLGCTLNPVQSKSSPILEPFPIGVFWPPKPENTSFATYEEIKDMNANFIIAGNGLHNYHTTANALTQADANGLNVLVPDISGFKWPSDEALEEITALYQGHPALLGYNLYDEPSAQAMARLGKTADRLKEYDADSISLVNLFPNYAVTSQLFGSDPFFGDYVRPDRSLGQTFVTMPHQTEVNTIQLYVDSNQWASNEELTLSLWDSPAKTTLIADDSLVGTGNGFPVFTLNATVSPSTRYYMELTHDGGGDGSVGWVVTAPKGENFYNDGTAYVNGLPVDTDIWHTINLDFAPASYEDYVYRWMRTGPDVLMYDHYPFKESNGFSGSYYANMEIIRKHALLGEVDFWTYIQSVGITGNLRAPSQDDLRYHIYTSLAYGAKGYAFFTYTTPDPGGPEAFHDGLILPNGTKNTSYNWARDINAEVLKLGPTLLSLTSEAVYHTAPVPTGTAALPAGFFWQPVATLTPPLVIGYFTDEDGRKYIMAVNRDLVNSRTIEFEVDGLPADVKEVSKSTGSEVATNYNATTGRLSSSFAPGEGRLYALPSGF